MMKIYKAAVVLGFSCVLSGCGWLYGEQGLIRDTSYDYTKAEQEKDLEIPPQLSGDRVVNYYPVPETQAQQAATGRQLDLRAPQMVLTLGEGVRVNRDADMAEVFIENERSTLWQWLHQFLQQTEVPLIINDEQQHRVVSGWIEEDDDGYFATVWPQLDLDGVRSKFRFELLEAERPSEVRLLVTNLATEIMPDDVEQWQPHGAQRKMAITMMNRFLGFYDERLQQAAVERVTAANSAIKLELGRNQQRQAVMIASADLDRVWAALPGVLERLGMQVNDKDRSKRLYFLNYEEKERGFFEGWFSSNERLLPIEYGLYQVVLENRDENTQLIWRDGEGQVLDAQLVTKLFPAVAAEMQKRRD